MNTFLSERSTPIQSRVLAATTHLLLTRGVRRLRTAEIARSAGTTESTLFRHFASLDEILAATYRRSWALVNKAVGEAAFARPVGDDPMQVLLGDTAAIWRMRSDPETCEAALVAFLFLRRRTEILGRTSQAADEQERFESRLAGIVSSILEGRELSDDLDHAAVLLRTLILNYAATVWLTWFCMPLDSDDVTEDQHNLSPDEAQLGVLSLIDRTIGANALHPLRGEC